MADFWDEATAVPGPDNENFGERLTPHGPSWSDVQRVSFEQNSAARVCARALGDGNMPLAYRAAEDFRQLDRQKSALTGWLESAQGE